MDETNYESIDTSAMDDGGCLVELGYFALGMLTWGAIAVGFGFINSAWGFIVGLLATPMAFQFGASVAAFVLLIQIGFRGFIWMLKLPWRLVFKRRLVQDGEETVLDASVGLTLTSFVVGCFLAGALVGFLVSFGEHAEFSAVASAGMGGAAMAVGCLIMAKLGFVVE